MERRLAAILAADVVGYTRLMGVDDSGTLQRLNELRQDTLEPLITEHRGRIVKLMGDGLLVEFASVVDAVSCALAWQDGVAKQESAVEEDKLLEIALEAGADDVREDDENFEILSAPENFGQVQEALDTNKIPVAASEVAMLPQNSVKLEDKKAEQMIRLFDFLEDHDDVQHVWANFDIDETQIQG